MRRFAVIGDPIAHTLSPVIHNHNFKLNGDNCSYEAIRVTPDMLANIRNIAKKHNLSGFNVTLPHKTAIISRLDDISPEARAVGAVNTVDINEDAFIGHNTDVSGYKHALLETFNLDPKLNVLILGGGGAAKAVHYVHHYLKHDVTIAVRNLEKLQGFSALPFRAVNIKDVVVQHYGCIINATPIGLSHEDVFTELDLNTNVKDTAIGIDLIYNKQTPFLDYFVENNRMDGLGMLVHQAMDAYTIWTGATGRTDAVKHMLAEML